jgi:MarR family transcriptional regulator, organic hydroperoxide resistance regulator
VSRPRTTAEPATREILRHWQEAVPNDRLAHLVKHAARGLARALQMRLTGVMEPTTFSALNAMEKLGYVTRRPNPKSRKEVQVFLTPKGRALKGKLVPLAEEVNEVALRGVAAADVVATRRALLALVANLAADEAASLTPRRRIPSTRELSQLLTGSARGHAR